MDWNGFLKDFCVGGAGLGCLAGGKGLEHRDAGGGANVSGRTCTKFEGNDPTVLSLLRRPVHQLPSPAFNASINSP